MWRIIYFDSIPRMKDVVYQRFSHLKRFKS